MRDVVVSIFISPLGLVVRRLFIVVIVCLVVLSPFSVLVLESFRRSSVSWISTELLRWELSRRVSGLFRVVVQSRLLRPIGIVLAALVGSLVVASVKVVTRFPFSILVFVVRVRLVLVLVVTVLRLVISQFRSLDTLVRLPLVPPFPLLVDGRTLVDGLLFGILMLVLVPKALLPRLRKLEVLLLLSLVFPPGLQLLSRSLDLLPMGLVSLDLSRILPLRMLSLLPGVRLDLTRLLPLRVDSLPLLEASALLYVVTLFEVNVRTLLALTVLDLLITILVLTVVRLLAFGTLLVRLAVVSQLRDLGVRVLGQMLVLWIWHPVRTLETLHLLDFLRSLLFHHLLPVVLARVVRLDLKVVLFHLLHNWELLRLVGLDVDRLVRLLLLLVVGV